MKNTRHRVAAALIAACFATSALAAGEAGMPPAASSAASPADGGAPGCPGGPGGPEMDGGPHGFGAHGPGMPGPDMPPGGPDGGHGDGRDGGFHGGPGMEGEHGGGPHDGMMGHLHRLNLSEAQEDKLFAIMHAAAPEHRAHDKAIHKAHEALAELGRAERFDDAKAAALARDLGQAIAAEALLRARTEAQSLAVLTSEQREQMRTHRSKGPQVRPGQPGQAGSQGQPSAGGQAGQPQGAPGRQ